MTHGFTRTTGWFKSSRSNNAAQCVEIRFAPSTVDVRDSKDREGAMLSVGGQAWQGFVAGVRAGGYGG